MIIPWNQSLGQLPFITKIQEDLEKAARRMITGTAITTGIVTAIGIWVLIGMQRRK